MLTQFLALDPKLLAALGAGASAFVAAMGYLLKLRHERKRTLRTVLFLLLGLRRHAVLSELFVTEFPAGTIRALSRTLTRMGLVLDEKDHPAMIAEAMPALVAAANASMRVERQQVQAKLSRAIEELAKDSPILAYRLSSASAPETSDAVSLATDTAIATGESSALAKKVGNAFSIGLHASSARGTRNSLTSSVKLAAWSAGLFSLAGALVVLREQNNYRPSEDFFEHLITPLRQLLEAETQQAPPASDTRAPAGALNSGEA